MSTRAIIALPLEGGGYETAWNWNDGYPDGLGKKLRRYFKEEWQVKQLIREHSFSCIMGPREIQKYKKILDRGDIIVRFSNAQCLLKRSYNGEVVSGEGPNGYFKDIPSMLEEDINYVYAFENGKWNTYK